MKIAERLKVIDAIITNMANLKISLNKIDDSVIINQIIAKLNHGLKLEKIKTCFFYHSDERKEEVQSTHFIGKQEVDVKVLNDFDGNIDADFIAMVVDSIEMNSDFIGVIEELRKKQSPFCLIFVKPEYKETFLSIKKLEESKLFVLTNPDKNILSVLKTIDTRVSMIDKTLFQKLIKTRTLFDILDKQINHNILNLKAKHILNKGEFIEMQFNDVRKLNKYSSGFKNSIAVEFSKIGSHVKATSSKFLNENNDQAGEVSKEIKSYIGFQEEESSKQQTIKVSEGFIESILEKTQTKAESTIDKEVNYIKIALNNLGNKINQDLLDIEVEPINDPPEINIVKEEIYHSVIKPRNSFDKTVPKKGLYTLFMDLRTPIFMMMPIIMIWGILGALLVKPDKGIVNEEVIYKNDKDVIVITKLPEFLGSDFLQASKAFIKELNEALNDGAFLIHGVEAIMFTQGVRNKEARSFIDEDNKELTLYLNSDRSDVIAKLNNPELNLLNKKSSYSGGGGYSRIGKALAGLPNPRLIFLLIMLLIAGYVRKKYKSFNIEKIHAVEKEKFGLIQTLQSDIHKYRSSIFTSWKQISDQNLKGLQDVFTKSVDKNISLKIDEENFKLKEKKLLYEKRSQNFKEKEKKLNDMLSGIGKMKKELESFQREIA